MMDNTRQRVFSGLQPSGGLHIGNYAGALRNWIKLQNERLCFFGIVDLHAITVPQEPAKLHKAARTAAMLYIACGLDPDKVMLFIQSQRREHAELCWILNCVTPIGWLERMVQYKTKSAAQASVSTGLLDYPVLQAADILLYQSNYVPVGEDQRQHVELTQDIAQRFNHLFGETFVVPQVEIPPVGAKIMGLDDPTAKKSKSVSGSKEGHALRLLDSPEVLRRTIQRAVTDLGQEIRFNPERPGVTNLLTIYQVCSGQTAAAIEAQFEGKGYAYLKREVADAVVEFLSPIQKRYAELEADPGYIEEILRQGAEQAAPYAQETLNLVKERMGLG
jgi:tryptophanyl-tRNA synthetase